MTLICTAPTYFWPGIDLLRLFRLQDYGRIPTQICPNKIGISQNVYFTNWLKSYSQGSQSNNSASMQLSDIKQLTFLANYKLGNWIFYVNVNHAVLTPTSYMNPHKE